MYKVAVVGDKDSVLAFGALGVHVYTPIGKEETSQTIDRLANDDYGVIFITEQMGQEVQDTIDKYNNQLVPAIILIPSNQGSMGIGLARVDRNVEKAVGTNIL